MEQTTVGSCAGGKGGPAEAQRRRRAGARLAAESGADFVVGLLVPINGSAGIWGPSSIACAQLAQAEINAAGGVLERRIRLRVIDSSDEALEVGSVTAELMHSGAIDAIVGMHTSQVRQRVLRDVARQIPYVYTPLYEGGERTPGVFALGETPEQQLRPAIEHLMAADPDVSLDEVEDVLRAGTAYLVGTAEGFEVAIGFAASRRALAEAGMTAEQNRAALSGEPNSTG